MKKILSMLLVLCMLMLPAFAEEFDGAQVIEPEIKNEIDLDGDGKNETVIIKREGAEGEEYLSLYVFGSDGSFHSYDMYVMWLEKAIAQDIDGDGIKEIFVSCDFYSDDYVTYCFYYTDIGGLTPMWFYNDNRYDDDEIYTFEGYGRITGINGDTITLTGSQDVLGTWMASREYLLWKGKFELIEGMYMFETAESDWADRPLILKQDITVKAEDGSDLPLKAGDYMLPVASDRETFVLMTTQDGRTFYLDIRYNDETGWGWFVNDIYEEDLFEYVPYAD